MSSPKSEESAIVVFGRAVIMLTSLLAIPLLALSGQPLPNGVWRLLPKPAQSVLAEWFPPAKNPGHAMAANVAPGFPAKTSAAAMPSAYMPAATPVPIVPTAAIQVNDAKIGPGGGSTDEEKLKSLGAVAYHLEKWGVDGELFRFVCEVAIDNDPRCRRHFEAVAPTAEGARADVLAQVEHRIAGQRLAGP